MEEKEISKALEEWHEEARMWRQVSNFLEESFLELKAGLIMEFKCREADDG